MTRRILPAVGIVALSVATWATLTKPLVDGLAGAVLISFMFALCGAGLLTAVQIFATPTCATCGRRQNDDHVDDWGLTVCPDADPAPVHQWETTEPVGYAEREAAASARAAEVGRGWRR